MAKLTLTDISAGYLSIATFNANNTLLETALENTLSRDGTSPNTMSAALDMNSNLINNVTDPVGNQDAATKLYVDSQASLVNELIDMDDVTTAGVTSGYVLVADGSAYVGRPFVAADMADLPTSTTTFTNKTIDGDSNTITNLDLGNEVDWAAADDVTTRTAFSSGDKVLIFEAGLGIRKVDFDDLPGAAGGGIDHLHEDATPQLGADLDLNGSDIISVVDADIDLVPNGTGSLRVLDSAGTDALTIRHDGTDATIDGVTSTNLNIANGFTTVDADTNVYVRNGHEVRVYDAADEDFIYMGHDGNNAYIDTAGTGVPGHIELRAETRVGGDGANGTFIVGDADFTDYLSIAGDGTDINFTIVGGGDLDFGDFTIRQVVIKDVAYTSSVEVVTTNAATITYTDGPSFELDMEASTGATTATISGGPVSGDYGIISVKVQQDGATAQTLAWAGGVMVWASGGAWPVTTDLDGITIYTFETWDGGTTWYGTGSDYS